MGPAWAEDRPKTAAKIEKQSGMRKYGAPKKERCGSRNIREVAAGDSIGV